MDAEVEATKGFVRVEKEFVGKVVLGWPVGGVGAPVKGERGLANV